jgi:hypothetical protein
MPQNLARAFEHDRDWAERGFGLGMYALALCYRDGEY